MAPMVFIIIIIKVSSAQDGEAAATVADPGAARLEAFWATWLT